MWTLHCLRRPVVKRSAPPVPETGCHLPRCHSSSLLASSLEFLGGTPPVLLHAGLYLFGNLFLADYIQNLQRNESLVDILYLYEVF